MFYSGRDGTPAYPSGHGLLEGKTVLVTAAAGTGIGFATAKRCVEEGARVVISDTHERRLGEAGKTLTELAGQEVPAIRCDVTVESDVNALVNAAIEKLGHIDVLVNNAGLGGTANVVDMTDEEWHRVLDVTLTGTFRMTRAVMRHMMDRGSGSIVNNASVLGWRAQPGQAHYAAAKAGVMALTRCSAVEAAARGVRINAVSPSLAMHAFLSKVTTPELLRDLTEREAFGRAAEPFEVANVIVFLASDLASYMTGEVVAVSSRTPEEQPMDTTLEGIHGEPFELDVERGKVREFARAVKAADAAYFAGDHPLTPPTFLTSTFHWEQETPGANPWNLLNVDQQRGLHAEQEYLFFGPPPRAGTRLLCRSRIEKIYEKEGRRGGTLTFAVMVTEFRDVSGKLVAEARMTGVETAKNPDGG